jgi:hypothetical protein
MLSAVSRATAAVLRGVKTSLTPQNFQNESTKIVSALSASSEYINSPSRLSISVSNFVFTLG